MPGWTGEDGGIRWELALERDDLLPGRLVPGTVRVEARDDVSARRLLVTLRGVERWKYEVTVSDGEHTRTEVRTGTEDLPAVPVLVAAGPVRLERGQRLELPLELPVPPLGPPTVVGEIASVTWSVEAKLDREGMLDSSIEAPVRVHQPTSLLRAGVVRVGQFALWAQAGGDDGGDLDGSIELDPVPLVAGAPFSARVVLRSASRVRVRSLRGELKARSKVTVSGGLEQIVTVWQGVVAGETIVDGERVVELEGVIDRDAPPTVELPHSTIQSRFELILDRAWAPDSRVARDVAVATTAEL